MIRDRNQESPGSAACNASTSTRRQLIPGRTGLYRKTRSRTFPSLSASPAIVPGKRKVSRYQIPRSVPTYDMISQSHDGGVTVLALGGTCVTPVTAKRPLQGNITMYHFHWFGTPCNHTYTYWPVHSLHGSQDENCLTRTFLFIC